MATTQKQWILEVHIMPGQGVNDPQGEAVLHGLKQLGFVDTSSVRVGKLIRVDVAAGDEDDARSVGEKMCEQLLVNPVIEEYEIVVREAAAE